MDVTGASYDTDSELDLYHNGSRTFQKILKKCNGASGRVTRLLLQVLLEVHLNVLLDVLLKVLLEVLREDALQDPLTLKALSSKKKLKTF